MWHSTVGCIVILTLSIFVTPLAADMQQRAKIPRIGIMEYSASWEPFLQGLRELGYTEGHNIAIEYQDAEGTPDRLADVAAELVRLKVDVIVTWGTPATSAARRATQTIPIIMGGVTEPVRTSLVASLARPGENIPGVSNFGAELSPKRLQLLLEVVPKTSPVAFLWNPANAGNVAHFENVQAAARALGVALLSVEVRSPDEFEGAFAAMMRERPDAFMLTAEPMHQLHAGWIIDFATKNRLPVMSHVKENVVAGGLMSYGPSLSDLYRRVATYVDKILKGARPADLPVEHPMKFELIINLKTVKALDLTIPSTLLFQADEVIK
jgi:putative tryptophan/tyrosine transport system substrate-binding protein